MPGPLIYEYRPQITQVVDHGAAADAVLSGATPPAEGARFDFHLEGPVSGPTLQGTFRGVDYIYFRADGRADVHIHGAITTQDGKRVALEAGGVAIPEEGSPVFQLREHVSLMSNHSELSWVNPIEVWARGVGRRVDRTGPRPGIRRLTTRVFASDGDDAHEAAKAPSSE